MSKALVVDDSAFMRAQLKQLLGKAGHEVICEAENGIDCLEKYKAYHPDFVTMDITMPEMDGITALKELKKINPDVPVIMISAMGQQSMVVDAITAGALNFIVKPFKDEEKIINMLKSL